MDKLTRREFIKAIAAVAVTLGINMPEVDAVEQDSVEDTVFVEDTANDSPVGFAFGENGRLLMKPEGDDEWHHMGDIERIEVPDPEGYGRFVTVGWTGESFSSNRRMNNA